MKGRYLFILLLSGSVQLLEGQTPGTVKWAFMTSGYIDSSPAVAEDGTIYVGSYDDKLYAINPDGTLKWHVSGGDNFRAAPAIAPDGTVYAPSDDGNLYAIRPDGSSKWIFSAANDFRAAAAISGDGTIYIGSNDYNLYAINPDGSQKWVFAAGDWVRSSPAIADDGTIYFGSEDWNLYALNPDGSVKWSFRTGGYIGASPAIGSDGTIYFGSFDQNIYAIRPDGTMKWSIATGEIIRSSPAIGADGTIYVGSDDHNLYAIAPDGREKWRFATGDYIVSSPAVGRDGIIYITSQDATLYALNTDGTLAWSYILPNASWGPPTITDDGILYVGCDSYELYAFYTSSMGLAFSPWPKYRKNLQNTGAMNILATDQRVPFTMTASGAKRNHTFFLRNNLATKVRISRCTFSNPAFSLGTALPLDVSAGAAQALVAHFTVTKTMRYQSTAQLQVLSGTRTLEVTTTLNEELFIDDGSESAHIARRALQMYESCRAIDPNSAATLNNLGLLYRQLGEYSTASQYLQSAVSKALIAQDSYAGIKMNQGVVHSDQKNPDQAKGAWHEAALDVAENSPLTPQLDYNLAHEAYTQDSLEVALAAVNRALTANSSNHFLRAKAHVLRGAIRFRLAAVDSCRADFARAQALDPDGPIGQIARENLNALATGVSTPVPMEPEVYTLLPNFPNPFNPETRLRFALPQPGEVVVEICNLAGQRVRRLISATMPSGWHETVWDGRDDRGASAGSGIYLCIIRSGRWQAMQKITLLR